MPELTSPMSPPACRTAEPADADVLVCRVLLLGLAPAVALPFMVAVNIPPSGTLVNQAAAVIGWGCVVAAMGIQCALSVPRGSWPVVAGLLIYAFAALAAAGSGTGEPWSLALSTAGLAGAAVIACQAGASAAAASARRQVYVLVAIAVIAASSISLAIGAIQVVAPDWIGGEWIARSSFPGRAVGNLRQPNHLSSLFLWAGIALAWLIQDGWRSRTQIASILALFAAMIVGIVMTASRTGMVGVLLLALWGGLEWRRSRTASWMLLAGPLIFGLAWLSLDVWASATHHVFGAEDRLATQTDISSSRFKIWADTLRLIASHPWWGVGVGGFNFAWSLTPSPNRAVAFFDHTHNIELQLFVELGIPLGAVVLLLFGWTLLRTTVGAWRTAGPDAFLRRSALMMVWVMVLHSQLEYPLWYAYFLLPTALLLGLSLNGEDTASRARSGVARVVVAGGLAIAIGGVLTLMDYMRVVQIFSPSESAAPLSERIAAGQRSLLFSHHADYAAVTTSSRPSEVMESFKGATHYLLDTRLMMAWAKAYAERGDLDRARFLSDRLREFHNEKSDDFFAPCTQASLPAQQLPFQCTPSSRSLGPADFR